MERRSGGSEDAQSGRNESRMEERIFIPRIRLVRLHQLDTSLKENARKTGVLPWKTGLPANRT